VQAESIESSPQQPLHRHRTHLHLLPETAIAPPRQHHLPDHEPLARFQHRQHRFHLRGSPRFVLGWVRAGSGHEFQLIRGQGTGPSQLSLLLQGVPLLAAHAQLAAQLRRGGRAGHPLLVLPFETGKLFLQLRLATGQPNAGRGIPQVVKDRTADARLESNTSQRRQDVLGIPYSRVSSAEQASSGVGLARQQASPRAYCETRGWTLWEGRAYSDAGVSAFGGQNLHHGALGRFLADLRTGCFGTGPVALLIEDIDRFSRAFPLEVLPVLIEDLLNTGVTISVMSRGKDYSR
jgi:hypothetical protein